MPNQLRVGPGDILACADQCPGVQIEGTIIVVVRNAEHLGAGGQSGSLDQIGVVIAMIIWRMAIGGKEVDMGAVAGAGGLVAIMAMRQRQHLGKEQADRRGHE